MHLSTAGFKVPWFYIKRLIANRWGVPPWAVDDAPYFEVEAELIIMQLENRANNSRLGFGR